MSLQPPLLSRNLHLLVAPTRATPCWIWGGLKSNTIISSPFRMSKLNLPVRYWLEANISQQVGPSLETHAEMGAKAAAANMVALGCTRHLDKRWITTGGLSFEHVWNRIHNHNVKHGNILLKLKCIELVGSYQRLSLFTYLLKSRQCVDDSKKCTSLVSKAWTTCNTFNHSVMGLRDAWLTFSGTWGLQIDVGPYGTRHFLSPQNTWDERIWANAPALATKRGRCPDHFTSNTVEDLTVMPPSIEEKGLSQIWHKSTFNIVQSESSALIFATLLPDNAGKRTAVAEGCTITMLYKEKVPQEQLPGNETWGKVRFGHSE